MIAVGTAGANTVVVVSVQSCAASPHAEIVVTRLGKGIRGVHLDIYREIENGERPAWGGVTGRHGIAKVPELQLGKYRVVAAFGKLDATMFLQASDDAGVARCEIKLPPPDAPIRPNPLPAPTASVRAREFRGVVEDESGAVIPRAKIRVLRKLSDKEDLAKIDSNERGQFFLHLARGRYLAVFQVPGFRTQVVDLKVTNGGWDAFRLTMEVQGVATNTPPTRWDAAK